ncbi:hypothetical protein [Amycolatopsis taiwanensis]|uniref:Uncharacterized protein n=1 Tax=Amycolatopsis taiwanensis TaxID=342230 RepID=A0A9W6R6V0_9PSEU|nr:hypothetical protein [Amycolatopsis taiwanensis]GLY69390.1 hypothetical protein Atai01_60090 [Amycolatopsis taiwanensis]
MSQARAGLSVDAGAFAVSPELAANAFTELSRLQDVVGELVREASVLSRTVPLGGGYAGEIGAFMARYGLGGPGSAAESLSAFGRQLQGIKDDIQKALDQYRATDESAAGGIDCHGG